MDNDVQIEDKKIFSGGDSGSRYEDYLAVNWHEGLLVRSEHLRHIDRRTESLLAICNRAALDQPGILEIDARTRTTGQLIDIEKSTHNSETDKFHLELKILTPFTAVSAGGRILVALPNHQNGKMQPEIKCVADITSNEPQDMLICLRPLLQDEGTVNYRNGGSHTISLTYPALQAEVIPVTHFMEDVSGRMREFLPAARVALDNNNIIIDRSYIPPLVKLSLADYFDTVLIDSLVNAFQELTRNSFRYLSTGGSLQTQDNPGAGILTRHYFYQVLNSILLKEISGAHNLRNISPVRFYWNLIFPVSVWFENFYSNIPERREGLSETAAAAREVKEISISEIQIGTDGLIGKSINLINSILETIMIIG